MLMPMKEAPHSLLVHKTMKEAKADLSRGPTLKKRRLSLINSKILEEQDRRIIAKF